MERPYPIGEGMYIVRPVRGCQNAPDQWVIARRALATHDPGMFSLIDWLASHLPYEPPSMPEPPEMERCESYVRRDVRARLEVAGWLQTDIEEWLGEVRESAVSALLRADR